METTDVRSVLAFLDDVAFGDAAEEGNTVIHCVVSIHMFLMLNI